MEKIIEYIIGMTFLAILVIKDNTRRKAKQTRPIQKKKSIRTKNKKKTKIIQFEQQDYIQAIWDEMRKDGY